MKLWKPDGPTHFIDSLCVYVPRKMFKEALDEYNTNLGKMEKALNCFFYTYSFGTSFEYKAEFKTEQDYVYFILRYS